MFRSQLDELKIFTEGLIRTIGQPSVGEISDGERAAFSEFLASQTWSSLKVYPASLQKTSDAIFILSRLGAEKKLLCVSKNKPEGLQGKPQEIKVRGEKYLLLICDLSSENATALRSRFAWTAPQPVGLTNSFGTGDRIGLATPGHIRAMKEYDIVPVLAQQSIREMTRTGRTPQQVMDDVTWAVFQEGFKEPWGSDADHLKTEADIRNTVAVGFNGFTLDPSDHINNEADTMSAALLDTAFVELFNTPEAAEDMLREYTGKNLTAKGNGRTLRLTISEEELKRLAVKYLAAIRHTIHGYGLIKELMGEKPFDFEMSVDETETPTTPAAHFIIANELKKAGVHLTAMAPRFVGEFQKAIDYIGDLDEFRSQLRDHVVLAEHFGPYKISVHSGSDKFSIFPIVGKETTRFHEKTAGTSYLEALRVVARHDSALFREIAAFALQRFQTDRASYHITTDLSNVPDVEKQTDDDLERWLEENDPRQVMHITFGSTLTEKNERGEFLFKNRILRVLNEHEEEHYEFLRILFVKHLESFNVVRK